MGWELPREGGHGSPSLARASELLSPNDGAVKNGRRIRVRREEAGIIEIGLNHVKESCRLFPSRLERTVSMVGVAKGI